MSNYKTDNTVLSNLKSKLLNTKFLLDSLFYIATAYIAFNYIKGNIFAAVDDSYITFRYADNLIKGNGLVFNVGERYYGSTAMGFAIILGCATFLIHNIQSILHFDHVTSLPTIAIALSAFSIWIIGVVWYRILNYYRFSLLRWLGGVIIACYFLSHHYSNMVPGFETYTYFAFWALSAYLYFYSEKYIYSGLTLAFAFVVRPDSLLFVLLIFIFGVLDHFFFKRKGFSDLGEIKYSILIFVILGLGWEIFLRFYFGSWLPGTLISKQAQVSLGHWKLFTIDLIVDAVKQRAFPGFLWILGLSLLGVLGSFLGQKVYTNPEQLDVERKNLLLITFMWLSSGIGLTSAYAYFHITHWPWYEIPIFYSLISALIASLFLLIEQLYRIFPRTTKYKYIVSSIVLIISIVTFKKTFTRLETWETPRVFLHAYSYDPVVEFFLKEEPNGTSIAIGEPGSFGFRLGDKYQVIDYLGLISPGVSQSIISGDEDYIFQKWRPEYIVISWPGKYVPLKFKWFYQHYRLIVEIEHEFWLDRLDRGVLVYKLKD